MNDYEEHLAGQKALDARNDLLHRRRAAMTTTAIAAAARRMPNLDDLPCVAEEPPICPDCHDTGYRVRSDGGAGAATRCDCKTPRYDGPESIPAADLEAYGCARSVSADVASTWDHDRAIWPPAAGAWPSGCRDDFGNRPKWLLLWGPEGNGKSRVAAWVMRRCMARGAACWWIDVPKTIVESRRAIGNDSKQLELNAAMAARLSRQVVFLDDLGAHRGDSEWQVQDLVASWVDERFESGGWTVATSNKSPSQLRNFYPPRTVSRICSGKIVELTGGDSRRRTWKTALSVAIKDARR